MTKWTLFNALMNGTRRIDIRTPIKLYKQCLVTSIEREDGSTHCWNVAVIDAEGIARIIFVRTID